MNSDIIDFMFETEFFFTFGDKETNFIGFALRHKPRFSLFQFVIKTLRKKWAF